MKSRVQNILEMFGINKSVPQPKLRVWKLGSLEHKILPTQEAVAKLAEILADIDGYEPVDIIWGPELTVREFEMTPGDLNLVTSLQSCDRDGVCCQRISEFLKVSFPESPDQQRKVLMDVMLTIGANRVECDVPAAEPKVTP